MSSAAEVHLSVIFPAYNEEAVITRTLASTSDFLRKQDYDWEIIVVDDASTDTTAERVTQFVAQRPAGNIRLLVNAKNSQKGAAICRGIMEARGKYAVFLDADYAYPIEQVPAFLGELENGTHIVIGNRVDPRTTYLVRPSAFNYIYRRYLFGRVFNLLVRMLLLPGISDTQCGIKAFRTATAQRILMKVRTYNFAFDVELLYIARCDGQEIAQVPVTYDYIDEPSTVKLFRHSALMFRSLLQIKLNGLMGRYSLNTDEPETNAVN